MAGVPRKPQLVDVVVWKEGQDVMFGRSFLDEREGHYEVEFYMGSVPRAFTDSLPWDTQSIWGLVPVGEVYAGKRWAQTPVYAEAVAELKQFYVQGTVREWTQALLYQTPVTNWYPAPAEDIRSLNEGLVRVQHRSGYQNKVRLEDVLPAEHWKPKPVTVTFPAGRYEFQCYPPEDTPVAIREVGPAGRLLHDGFGPTDVVLELREGQTLSFEPDIFAGDWRVERLTP